MSIEEFAGSVADALAKYNILVLRVYNSSESDIKEFMERVECFGKGERANYRIQYFCPERNIGGEGLLEKALSMQNGDRVVLGVADSKNYFGEHLIGEGIFDVNLGECRNLIK